MPMPKTWKTSLEAHRHIPISSPISLAAKPAVDEVLRPVRAVDGMSSTKLI